MSRISYLANTHTISATCNTRHTAASRSNALDRLVAVPGRAYAACACIAILTSIPATILQLIYFPPVYRSVEESLTPVQKSTIAMLVEPAQVLIGQAISLIAFSLVAWFFLRRSVREAFRAA